MKKKKRSNLRKASVKKKVLVKKKSARAKTSKKNINKKRTSSKAQQMLRSIPEDHLCFWLCDGRILRSLRDLVDALNNMADEVFFYHVNQEKNDFANWINEVIQDKTLAKKINKTKSKAALIRHIKSRVVALEKQVK